MEAMSYAHYFQISSQANIYSITQIPVVNECNKLLVASLKREIIYFEYPENSSLLIPSTKEILFTYIPNGAEIISIDAFNKSKTSNDIVIGITIIKTDVSKESYFNIYTGEETSEFNIDNVSQNCLMIDLDYIPYQLYHTSLPHFKTNSTEIVWLLSGSDEKIHLYQESQDHTYKEEIIEQSFIELASPPSIVLWMDIVYFDSMKRRLTAYACESGFVKLSHVDVTENVIISTWDIQFVNMISNIQLFVQKPNQKTTGIPNYNLLVTNTSLPSVVLSDVLNHGFSKRSILQKSNFFNLQSSACIADIDYDGENEILIGTYGQEVLRYKYEEESNSWIFFEQRRFGNPIYSIQHFDVTGDGMRELIVLTLKGVHILQNKPEDVEKLLIERLEVLEF